MSHHGRNRRLHSVRAACIVVALCGARGVYARMPVTAVGPDGDGTLAVTFAGRVTVAGVRVVRMQRSGRLITSPVLPRYTARTGREYPLVEVLTARLRSELAAAVVSTASDTGRVRHLAPVPADDPSFEVRLFQLKPSSGSVRASAEVVFGEELSVSCRIVDGRRGPWVSWPSERDDRGTWRRLFTFEDAAYGRSVEKELLDRFRTGLVEAAGGR